LAYEAYEKKDDSPPEYKVYGRNEEFQSILEMEGLILATAVSIVKPRAIFESGTCSGYSTGWMVRGLQAASIIDVVIHTCDFIQHDLDKCNNIPKGIAEVKFFWEPSTVLLKRKLMVYDFAFLDGTHETEGVYREMELLELDKDDAPTVFFHDVRPDSGDPLQSPHLAINEFIENKGCKRPFYLIRPGSLATNMENIDELVKCIKGISVVRI
jgi:hypothetical protein